jgi:hypothetical protein
MAIFPVDKLNQWTYITRKTQTQLESKFHNFAHGPKKSEVQQLINIHAVFQEVIKQKSK